MSTDKLDTRLHAATADLADIRLKGRVEAKAFVEGKPMQVSASRTPLRIRDDGNASYDTELIHGEPVLVFAATEHGSSWVQSGIDGYV